MDSTCTKTAKSFIAAYSILSVEDFLPLLADDYSHTFAPASLERLTAKNKSEFAVQMFSLRGFLSGFTVYIKELIDSESSNQVVVWATSETMFREEVKDTGIPDEEWKYQGEYVFMFTMDEGGERITRLVEFLDSKGTDRMMGLVARARRNMKGSEQGEGV
jgi:ketosteroid isomerase-like protein